MPFPWIRKTSPAVAEGALGKIMVSAVLGTAQSAYEEMAPRIEREIQIFPVCLRYTNRLKGSAQTFPHIRGADLLFTKTLEPGCSHSYLAVSIRYPDICAGGCGYFLLTLGKR